MLKSFVLSRGKFGEPSSCTPVPHVMTSSYSSFARIFPPIKLHAILDWPHSSCLLSPTECLEIIRRCWHDDAISSETQSAMSKVWLITGCSSGFGQEIAVAALNNGDKVVATARDVSKIENLKKRGAVVKRLDVLGSDNELQEIIKDVLAVVDHIDVLVNNAGYILVGGVEECRYKISWIESSRFPMREFSEQFDSDFDFRLLQRTRSAKPVRNKCLRLSRCPSRCPPLHACQTIRRSSKPRFHRWLDRYTCRGSLLRLQSRHNDVQRVTPSRGRRFGHRSHMHRARLFSNQFSERRTSVQSREPDSRPDSGDQCNQKRVGGLRSQAARGSCQGSASHRGSSD